MNNDELQMLIKSFASNNGVSQEQLKDDKNKEKVEKLLKNLNSKQSEQIKDILSNPEKSKKIINSPEAQALIKKLMK